jgi:hypothetical protein
MTDFSISPWRLAVAFTTTGSSSRHPWKVCARRHLGPLTSVCRRPAELAFEIFFVLPLEDNYSNYCNAMSRGVRCPLRVINGCRTH